MAEKITTMEVRERLGEYLDRVALRHDRFVIERKGKPLAAMVPVETLAEMEKAARAYILSTPRPAKTALTQAEADRLADEAKHRSRPKKRK